MVRQHRAVQCETNREAALSPILTAHFHGECTRAHFLCHHSAVVLVLRVAYCLFSVSLLHTHTSCTKPVAILELYVGTAGHVCSCSLSYVHGENTSAELCMKSIQFKRFYPEVTDPEMW
jgi:hypothetical protein